MAVAIEIKTFEDLECWKSATELRRLISTLVRKLPKEEKFTLSDQLIRASRSVTNNIAEGYGRFHYQENIQYCRQSRGSLYEILDHLIIASDENYISSEEFKELRALNSKCLALLNGYINYLSRQKKQDTGTLTKL